VNLEIFRDALFSSKVLNRHSIKSATTLHSWLLDKNDGIARKYQMDCNDEVPARALEKARKFQFYLGLESSWMNE